MATGECDNARCTCSPCMCGDDCRCGEAKLGGLERQVMAVLWERPGEERTGRDVADRLPRYAYTTVATVLERLTHKGLVHRRMDERVIRFLAVDTPGALAAQAMREALEASPDPGDALERFVDTATADEIEALRHALAQRGVNRSSPA